MLTNLIVVIGHLCRVWTTNDMLLCGASGIQTMKQRTRRYSRKQIKWLTNRLLKRKHTSVVLVLLCKSVSSVIHIRARIRQKIIRIVPRVHWKVLDFFLKFTGLGKYWKMSLILESPGY